MQTTSLATSRKIFELLGWIDPDNEPGEFTDGVQRYSLAYLLERLPNNLELTFAEKDYVDGSDLGERTIKGNVFAGYTAQSQGTAGYQSHQGSFYLKYADNPTEAAGKLIIALAEAGILTK